MSHRERWGWGFQSLGRSERQPSVLNRLCANPQLAAKRTVVRAREATAERLPNDFVICGGGGSLVSPSHAVWRSRVARHLRRLVELISSERTDVQMTASRKTSDHVDHPQQWAKAKRSSNSTRSTGMHTSVQDRLSNTFHAVIEVCPWRRPTKVNRIMPNNISVHVCGSGTGLKR